MKPSSKKVHDASNQVIKACIMFVIETGLFEEVKKKHPDVKYDPAEKFADDISVGVLDLCEATFGPLTVANHKTFTRSMNRLCDQLGKAPDCAAEIVADFLKRHSAGGAD